MSAMGTGAGTAPAGAGGRRRVVADRRLLGDLLLEAGLVTPEGLTAGLAVQRLGGGRLGVHLMRGGHVVPAAFHLFLGEHLESLRPDLVEDLRAGSAAGRLPARLAHHYGMVPVREADGVLELAVAAFDDPRLRPAVEALVGLPVEPIIAPPALLSEALAAHYPAEVEPGIVHRAAGDNVLVISDPDRGLRASELDRLRADAPSGEWVRSIVAAAFREGARRVAIEPRAGDVEVVFSGSRSRLEIASLPYGPFPGIAALLEGLARIAARGRIVPRAGRFVVRSGKARLHASLLALPGLAGRAYRIDLRSERRGGPGPAALSQPLRELHAAVEGLVARGRGLLALAATSPGEWSTALETIEHLLGDRLPRRQVIGSWDERGAAMPPEAAAIAGAVPGAGPDLVVLAAPWRVGDGAWVGALARDRVVLAAVDAADACTAGEALARGSTGAGSNGGPVGILAARHLETVCDACRTGFDLRDLIALLPDGSAAPAPAWTAPGCAECRGSGAVAMTPVCEYLALQPGTRARALREESPGRPTILRAALFGALQGTIDAREVVRLLVHEPR
jgi:type IV pilus assembly protein PilB